MEAYQYNIRKEQEEIEKDDIGFDIENISLKNSEVRIIDSGIARDIILKYEWLKTMPLFNKYFFGIYFNVEGKEYLGGVVIYSEEYSANKITTWDKYAFSNKIILLSRGVCVWWTPKNTASYFISKTTDWLKKNSDYKVITATVDPAAGEMGVIYQSLNWHYVGLMIGNYGKNGRETKRFSVFANGKLKHSRSVRREFGTIKKDVILEKYPDAIFLPQYRKRRYFYFIGNKKENIILYNNVKHLILEYPKKNNEIAGVIYLITNKINNKKYVGQTTRGFNDRYNEYLNKSKSCNPYLLKEFDKYGFENFEFKIIDTGQTIDELNYKEIRHVSEHNTTNRKLGYNIESGGVNAVANPETIAKLSTIRKDVKQTPEWIQKRIDKVAKPVIKLDLVNNLILERYPSLADAGRNNKDSLSYQQILRSCLAYTKDNDWCYEEDFLNSTLKEYKTVNIKKLEEFDDELLKIIYKEYKNNISIRELSTKYSINFSTLNGIIKNIEKPINSDFDYNSKYILYCKKTNKEFTDYLNKSGSLTTHILETYPKVILESKFKRKQIEVKTGKPWYYDYFEFKLVA